MANPFKGQCVCGQVQYVVSLQATDDARTSLCHCHSCKRAFGTNYGLTTKVPLDTFQYVKGESKSYKQDNGVIREFCTNCGTFICEYGEQAAGKFRYVMWGTLDDGEKLPPKGEFFCSQRDGWMPEVPGIFHKQEIKS